MSKLYTTYLGPVDEDELALALDYFVDSLELQPGEECYGYTHELPGAAITRQDIDDKGNWISVMAGYDLKLDAPLVRLATFVHRL